MKHSPQFQPAKQLRLLYSNPRFENHGQTCQKVKIIGVVETLPGLPILTHLSSHTLVSLRVCTPPNQEHTTGRESHMTYAQRSRALECAQRSKLSLPRHAALHRFRFLYCFLLSLLRKQLPFAFMSFASVQSYNKLHRWLMGPVFIAARFRRPLFVQLLFNCVFPAIVRLKPHVKKNRSDPVQTHTCQYLAYISSIAV